MRAANCDHTTKSNLRRIFVTASKQARDLGYLQQDRKTAPDRAATFDAPELAPAIFTSAELRKILAACSEPLLPHIVIGAFSGTRAAQIKWLDWKGALWERGYIEIKVAKAKTKARRHSPAATCVHVWSRSGNLKDSSLDCRTPAGHAAAFKNRSDEGVCALKPRAARRSRRSGGKRPKRGKTHQQSTEPKTRRFSQ